MQTHQLFPEQNGSPTQVKNELSVQEFIIDTPDAFKDPNTPSDCAIVKKTQSDHANRLYGVFGGVASNEKEKEQIGATADRIWTKVQERIANAQQNSATTAVTVESTKVCFEEALVEAGEEWRADPNNNYEPNTALVQIVVENGQKHLVYALGRDANIVVLKRGTNEVKIRGGVETLGTNSTISSWSRTSKSKRGIIHSIFPSQRVNDLYHVPDVGSLKIEEGDRIMICSRDIATGVVNKGSDVDNGNSELSDEELQEILSRPTTADCAARLRSITGQDGRDGESALMIIHVGEEPATVDSIVPPVQTSPDPTQSRDMLNRILHPQTPEEKKTARRVKVAIAVGAVVVGAIAYKNRKEITTQLTGLFNEQLDGTKLKDKAKQHAKKVQLVGKTVLAYFTELGGASKPANDLRQGMKAPVPEAANAPASEEITEPEDDEGVDDEAEAAAEAKSTAQTIDGREAPKDPKTTRREMLKKLAKQKAARAARRAARGAATAASKKVLETALNRATKS